MEKTIEEIKRTIETLYNAGCRDSILLLGPPGTGKTEGIYQVEEQIAHEMGKEFVVYDDSKLAQIVRDPDKYHVMVEFSLLQCEPSDLIGIPRDDNGHIVYRPLGWAIALTKCSGCLFLDEITNVQRLDVQSVMLKILLEKMVGFLRLHRDVVIIGAGNLPEHSELAMESFPEPVRRGRVIMLRNRVPTLNEWINYMDWKVKDYDKRVVLFLSKFPERFYDNRETQHGYEIRASPRSWTKLASISHKLPADVLEMVANGLIGEQAALFLSFLQTKVPSLSELQSNVFEWKDLSSDQKYFVTLEWSNCDVDVLMEKYLDILNMLALVDHEFLVLGFSLMDREKRKAFALKTRVKAPTVFQVLLNAAKIVEQMRI